MAAPDDGELEGGVGGASGVQGPDAGDVAGFVAPMDDGERGVHLQMSMLQTDMRDVYHGRLLQQITSGTTVSPELKHVRESGAMVVPWWCRVVRDHEPPLQAPALAPVAATRRRRPQDPRAVPSRVLQVAAVQSNVAFVISRMVLLSLYNIIVTPAPDCRVVRCSLWLHPAHHMPTPQPGCTTSNEYR